MPEFIHLHPLAVVVERFEARSRILNINTLSATTTKRAIILARVRRLSGVNNDLRNLIMTVKSCCILVFVPCPVLEVIVAFMNLSATNHAGALQPYP